MTNLCIQARYPIVARRAWPTGRVRRASKGILHTRQFYSVEKWSTVRENASDDE